ncbi:MAG: hypothetical protein AAF394_05705 [Planctomycetota bacterium]
MSRREKIEAMLKDEPQDVFLRYSLAMEMSSAGEVEEALELFSALANEKPPHVPAFFRSAQILADNDQVNESRRFLREGIEVARAQGDMHAAGEMSEMLAELGSEGE